MNSPENIVFIINLILASFAYLWLYPQIVKDDMMRLMNYDLLVSGVAILIAGILFYGSNIIFSFFNIETNWFWFSLISYFIIETPFVLWYLSRNDMWKKF